MNLGGAGEGLIRVRNCLSVSGSSTHERRDSVGVGMDGRRPTSPEVFPLAAVTHVVQGE